MPQPGPATSGLPHLGNDGSSAVRSARGTLRIRLSLTSGPAIVITDGGQLVFALLATSGRFTVAADICQLDQRVSLDLRVLTRLLATSGGSLRPSTDTRASETQPCCPRPEARQAMARKRS